MDDSKRSDGNRHANRAECLPDSVEFPPDSVEHSPDSRGHARLLLNVSIGAALLCSFASGCQTTESAPSSPRRPNVILLMADDLGYGDTGFNGNKIIRTPHLDEMASVGLVLERFYAAAPVCSPTRGTALTGRHGHRFGVFTANSGHLRCSEENLAELLSGAGYTTGHFGKWHLGTLTTTDDDSNRGRPGNLADYSPPWQNGFDESFSTEAKVPTWDPLMRPNDTKGRKWWKPAAQAESVVDYGTAYWSNGKRVREPLRGDDSRIIMDRALPFIEGAVAGDRAFFAVIWFHAPHLPVVSGPEFTQLYPERTEFEQHYFGCISALDEQVGRLRSTLRELEVEQDTLLFFCSDNGPEGKAGQDPGSSGGLRGRKRSLFEGGVRVPALVEWPGVIEPGTRSSVPTVTSDYLPTIASLVGLPMPSDRPLDGIDLTPLLEGRPFERATPIAFEAQGKLALIGERYKLIRPKRSATPEDDEPGAPPPSPEDFQLFDLVLDPGEERDVASEHPELVASMLTELWHWRRSCRESLERGAP